MTDAEMNFTKSSGHKYLTDRLDQYLYKIQYKILTSILAERLKVVPDIINKDQCDFVINR